MVDGIEGSWQIEQYQSTNVTLVNHADHAIVYADNSRLRRMKRAVRWPYRLISLFRNIEIAHRGLRGSWFNVQA